MKRIFLTFLLIFASVSSFAQAPSVSDMPNAKYVYYVKDGVKHYAYTELLEPERCARVLYIPEQEGYPEMQVFTPDMISEYGFPNENLCYISARIETEEGEKWYFMNNVQALDDNSRILYIPVSALVNDTDVYYKLDGDKATEISTDKDTGPMWNFMASETGYNPSTEGRVRYPRKLTEDRVIDFYNAYAAHNYKMLPKNRFGIAASYALYKPWYVNMYTIIHENTERLVKHEHNYGHGVSAGCFFRIHLHENISFQPELLYLRYSHSGTDRIEETTFKESVEVNAVRIPLMLRVCRTHSKSNWMSYAEVGVNVNGDYVNLLIEPNDEDRFDSSFYNYDVYWGIGGGIEYHINAKHSAWLGVRANFIYDFRFAACELTAGFSIFNF